MATLSVWEVNNGSPVAINKVTDDSIKTGRIDYLGHGFILMTNDTGVYLLNYSSKVFSVTKILYKWGTGANNEDGFGIACNHSRQTSDGNEHGFDSHQCYILRGFTEGEAIGYDLILFDYIGGKNAAIVKTVATFGADIPSGLVFNGKDLYLRSDNIDAEGPNNIYQYNINVGVGKPVQSWLSSGTHHDFCFDGQAYWVISNLNLRYFDANGWTGSSKSTAHSLTNPRGLTFDGKNLYALSS